MKPVAWLVPGHQSTVYAIPFELLQKSAGRNDDWW
jgi:hypothetical protein